MSHDRAEAPLGSPHGGLESSLINEYLRMQGYDHEALQRLSEGTRAILFAQASLYASSKLSEVDARSKYVHDMHDGRTGKPPRGME